MLYEYMQ